MLVYIDYPYYIDLYGDEAIVDQDHFDILASLSSDIIDNITQYRIVKAGGIQALPDFVQTLIKKATAAQINYLGLQGTDVLSTGIANQGFTVGKVSISGSGDGQAAARNFVAPMALMYLEQTGLLERGIPVCSDPYRPVYLMTL